MLIAERAARRIEPPPPPVKRFLDHLFIECGLAGSTVSAYQRDLRDFWAFLVANEVEPAFISMDDVQRYMIELKQRGFALSTIVRHLSTIKVFLRHLLAERVLRRDIASLIESPRRWRRLPNTVRYVQIESLLNAPDPRDEFFLRDRALLEMLYATGMRVSEVVDLDLARLNLTLGYVRCIGKGRKERIIPVGGEAIEAVRNYLDIQRPRLAAQRGVQAVFLSRTGRPLDRTSIWRLVRKYAATAELSIPVSPHTIRHCFATHLLAGGADLRVLQELLGHADVTTTQIYTHVDEIRLKQVHEMYHPRP
jgi:integrase/recombinase XerD